MRKGFTFGYKKSLPPIEITPGPGDYTLSSLQTSFEKPLIPTKSSQAPRFLSQNLITPGPGSYNPKEFSTKSHISLPLISKSLRTPLVFKSSRGIPGPGEYEIGLNSSNQRRFPAQHANKLKFSLQTSSKPNKNMTPGPGHYSINESFYRSGHSVKIFQSEQNSKNPLPAFIPVSGTPGPGRYQSTGGTTVRRGPQYSFGQKPQNLQSIENPGPDSYNVSFTSLSGLGNKFSRNGNFSFPRTGKSFLLEELREKRYFPGPGSYNLAKRNPLLRENGVVFSTALRPLDRETPRSPGPGAYGSLTMSFMKKKQGYCQSLDIKGKRWRRRFKKQESYDSIEEEEKKREKEQKKQEFLERLKEISLKNKQEYGTPLHCKTPKNTNNNENFLTRIRRMNSDSEIKTKGFQKKPDFLLSQPSPTNKNLLKPPTLANTKSFSIGKSVRKLEYLDPGNVNPNIQRSPGPAGYFVERDMDKKAIKIATSKRDDRFFVLNKNPGVGNYSVPNSSFLRKPKKKKKLNENLVKLLKRIEMKVHPEKRREGKEQEIIKKTRKKSYAVITKT